MTFTTWLSLVAVCTLGAISPGPSLAVVMRQTLCNGRSHGVLTGIAHAAGVALWAALTLFGLALLVTQQPLLYRVITYSGAAYLAWIGIKALRSTQQPSETTQTIKTPKLNALRDGLAISLLNPKLAIFFIALFSQFVSANQSRTEQWLMMGTAAVIDALWYCLVAVILSHSRFIGTLQRQSVTLERISGLIFIALALRVITL